MNKFIVRFTIFYCAIYFIYVLAYAWNGINVFDDSYKLLLEYCLFVLAKEHPKYHCKFARFLALSLFVTELITYLDNCYSIIPPSIGTLAVLSIIWVLGISSTIILAILHFRRVRRIKKIRGR